jgi:hypothetical protein
MKRIRLPRVAVRIVIALVVAVVAGLATALIDVHVRGPCAPLVPGPDGTSTLVCLPPEANYVLAVGVAVAFGVLVWLVVERMSGVRRMPSEAGRRRLRVWTGRS